MNNFGGRLLKLRKQKGISQSAMAVDLCISQSSISNYESGVFMPDASIMLKLSEYFNVPVEYLLNDLTFSINVEDDKEKNGEKVINSYKILIKDLTDHYEKVIADLVNENKELKKQKDFV